MFAARLDIDENCDAQFGTGEGKFTQRKNTDMYEHYSQLLWPHCISVAHTTNLYRFSYCLGNQACFLDLQR